jgi:RimJ/RimL family protein N-acetyltransferase
VLVDESDHRFGLALVRIDDDRPSSAVLNAMWVAPEVRGRRAATLLCDACAAWATERGLHELTLTVVAGNEAALHAYEAAGFAIRGETRWSRDGRTLDELVMSRHLKPRREHPA